MQLTVGDAEGLGQRPALPSDFVQICSDLPYRWRDTGGV